MQHYWAKNTASNLFPGLKITSAFRGEALFISLVLPFWKCQCRYQFKATAYHENQICQTIQQCTYLAFTSEFSGEIAICHIAETTEEINDPESTTLDSEK